MDASLGGQSYLQGQSYPGLRYSDFFLQPIKQKVEIISAFSRDSALLYNKNFKQATFCTEWKFSFRQ